MIGAWLRRRRRRKLLAQPFPDAWRAILRRYPFYARLGVDERRRLEDDLRVLVAEKSWEGVGIEIDDEVRVTIAAQAAALLLGLEHDYFRRVTSILVYPTTFPSVFERGHGVRSEGDPLLGQAWYRGPVLLAWDSVKGGALDENDGRNVVLHEFAHRLDMLDGFVDGTPPLASSAAYAAWRRVMTEEYERLRTGRRRRAVLDAYGATNEAEFFAVATEAFFEKPRQMEKRHPELYGLLRDYYRQDPAARRRAAAAGEA